MVLPNAVPTCFIELLAAHAAQRGSRLAIIDRDRRLTYAALHEQSRALAAGLTSIGVRPGDRVAVWLPNSLAWMVTFLACARLGALVLAVNTRFRAHELEDIIARGKVDWLVMWPSFKNIPFAEILEGVTPLSLERLRGIVCYEEEHTVPSSVSD